jgi:hypothetical protein
MAFRASVGTHGPTEAKFAAKRKSSRLPLCKRFVTIAGMDDQFPPISPDGPFPNEQQEKLPDGHNGKSGNRVRFTDETIESLLGLGEVLRAIHNRLVSEGFTIRNGKTLKKPTQPIVHGENHQHRTPNT